MLKAINRFIFLAVASLSTNLIAHACDTQAHIWRAFVDQVRQEYLGSTVFQENTENGFVRDSREMRAIAYGHAFGRLASAVNNEPEKRDAFECVSQLLDQQSFDITTGASWYRVTQSAARGFYDDRVNADFGVTDVSPLHSVFDEAARRVGRVNYDSRSRSGPDFPPDPTSQSNTTSGVFDAGRTGGGWPGGFPSGSSGTSTPIGGTATGSTYTNICPDIEYYSLAQAAALLETARGMANAHGNRQCYTNMDWQACDQIFQRVDDASDHLLQIVDQNFDGINKCRKCDYSPALRSSGALPMWEEWFTNLGFSKAAGFGGRHQNLRAYQSYPQCSFSVTAPVTTPISEPGTAGASSRVSGTWVLSDQRIDRVTPQNTCSVDYSSFTWDQPDNERYLKFDYSPPPRRIAPGQQVSFSAQGTARMGEKSPAYASGEVGFSLVHNGRKIESVTINSYNKGGNRGKVYVSIPRKTETVKFPDLPSDPATSKVELIWTDDWCSRAIFEYKFQP